MNGYPCGYFPHAGKTYTVQGTTHMGDSYNY